MNAIIKNANRSQFQNLSQFLKILNGCMLLFFYQKLEHIPGTESLRGLLL